MFLPTVVARQQAFIALGAEPSVQQEVRVPAEWQLGSSSAVSLSIGAGKPLLVESSYADSLCNMPLSKGADIALLFTSEFDL